MSDVLRPLPAADGPLQRLGSRAQSQTHAAIGLSGSRSPVLQAAHPHDQTERSPTSLATCFAARAWSFVTSSHELRGAPSRPPEPRVVWKPSISPSLLAGRPAEVNSATRLRNRFRSVRLPSIGPCLAIPGAAKYDSRTTSAYCESCRHQSPASSPMYGALGTRITGRAPRAESVCM